MNEFAVIAINAVSLEQLVMVLGCVLLYRNKPWGLVVLFAVAVTFTYKAVSFSRIAHPYTNTTVFIACLVHALCAGFFAVSIYSLYHRWKKRKTREDQ